VPHQCTIPLVWLRSHDGKFALRCAWPLKIPFFSPCLAISTPTSLSPTPDQTCLQIRGDLSTPAPILSTDDAKPQSPRLIPADHRDQEKFCTRPWCPRGVDGPHGPPTDLVIPSFPCFDAQRTPQEFFHALQLTATTFPPSLPVRFALCS